MQTAGVINPGILLGFSFVLSWAIMRVVSYSLFYNNCLIHIYRAAQSQILDVAKEELDIALRYLEKEKATSGYTSVLYRSPNEDIGLWYNNLKILWKELHNPVPGDANSVLFKMRRILLEVEDSRECVRVPQGISIVPYNRAFASLLCVGLTLILFSSYW